METSTYVTMAMVMGFIWGGFAVLLATAFRKEGAKRQNEDRDI